MISTTLFIDSIKSTVKVNSYDDYEWKVGSGDERIYFTKFSYHSINEIIEPTPNYWSHSCFCKLPSNPDSTYVFCEKY